MSSNLLSFLTNSLILTRGFFKKDGSSFSFWLKFRCTNGPTNALSMIWYQFWRQIIFKREEARLSSSLLNIICRQIWYQRKSDYMDRAWECPRKLTKKPASFMPYPCSHFYFDIKFGDRLYSKEKRTAWPLLFWI